MSPRMRTQDLTSLMPSLAVFERSSDVKEFQTSRALVTETDPTAV